MQKKVTGKNPATRYRTWAVQYNYQFDTRDSEGNPKNPDPNYFTAFNSQQYIDVQSWLQWRIWWLRQRIIFGQKQLDFVHRAINKGYPDLQMQVDAQYSPYVIPQNQKQNGQKFGLLLGSFHNLDMHLNGLKSGFEPKPDHIHTYIELDSGITESAAIKFFEPSREDNLKNVQSKVKYGRYLLHASESAFSKYKHNYDENALVISNLPDSFCVHCTYHYLTLGKTQNSKKALEKTIADIASWLNDRISAGIITVNDAINAMKMQFGADSVEEYRSSFKNSQKDYLQLSFDSQKANGRNFELNYINGLGHAGKSDLAEAIPKACDAYHRFFPTTIGGSRKTTDIANGWLGEPQLVVQEMDGFSEDFRMLASLFDPNHVSMASSRNSNVQLAIDRAFISNSAPEVKWILDNLLSHARYEKNEARTALIMYLKKLDLTVDQLTRLDKLSSIVIDIICQKTFELYGSDKTEFTQEDVRFQILGSQYSTSDTLVDWCVQLARRLTYNIQIFTPHQFTFNKFMQYQREPMQLGKSLNDFSLNQRITAVYPLKDLDAYLSQHSNLFHLPNLAFETCDNGYFLEPDPLTETGLCHKVGYQEEPMSFEKYAKEDLSHSIDESVEDRYKTYIAEINTENLQNLRVASYNQNLVSCPLFSDDPENDSIILVSKFNADVNRLVTGCAIGLSHCASYEDYRKNVEKVGIAIAKVQGNYVPEAKDYTNPADVKKRLLDIAQNGL